MIPYAAIGLTVGIITYDSIDIRFAALLCAAMLLAALGTRIAKVHFRCVDMISLSIFFLIGNIYANITADAQRHPLNRFISSYSIITARICDMPTENEENFRYTVVTENVLFDSVSHDIKERMIMTSSNRYNFNDRVTFIALIKPIDGAMNEYGFDAAKYYKSEGIYFRAYSVEDSLAPVQSGGFSFLAPKIKLCGFIDQYIHGDKGAVLKAVLTGDKSGFSDDYNDVLLKTGLRGFFYQAHIHIMLIMFFLSLLSSFVHKRIRDILFLIILLVYAAYNSSDPACLKAAFIAAGAVISLSCVKHCRKPDVIGICVLAFLGITPMIVFNSSFVCCVLGSCSVYMFGEYAADKLRFIGNTHIRYYFSASLICTLSTLAVSSLYFNQITPYKIIFGLICIPLTVILLISAPVMLLMLALFSAAPIISDITAFCVYSYLKLPYIIERLPFSSINLPTASVPVIILNIFAMRYAYLRIHKLKSMATGIACVALCLVISVCEITRINTLEMTFVNVGQGDGAVLSIPYRCNILIDGGGGNAYSDYDPGKTVFVPYLKSHGKTKIEAAFISHFHKDHAEGIIRAVENLKVSKVFAPLCGDNPYKKELEAAAERYGTKIIYISSDTHIAFKNGLEFDVYTADSNTKRDFDENNEALVIKAHYGEFDCLFTGDMTKLFEDNMLAENKISKCEVLKIPHHGSRTAANQDFINAVSPEICVISLGAHNSYGFPHQETIDTLSERTVLRTDDCGDITFSAKSDGSYTVTRFK